MHKVSIEFKINSASLTPTINAYYPFVSGPHIAQPYFWNRRHKWSSFTRRYFLIADRFRLVNKEWDSFPRPTKDPEIKAPVLWYWTVVYSPIHLAHCCFIPEVCGSLSKTFKKSVLHNYFFSLAHAMHAIYISKMLHFTYSLCLYRFVVGISLLYENSNIMTRHLWLKSQFFLRFWKPFFV